MVEAVHIQPTAENSVQSLRAAHVEVALDGEPATPEGYAREVSEATSKRGHAMLMTHVRRSVVTITLIQMPGS